MPWHSNDSSLLPPNLLVPGWQKDQSRYYYDNPIHQGIWIWKHHWPYIQSQSWTRITMGKAMNVIILTMTKAVKLFPLLKIKVQTQLPSKFFYLCLFIHFNIVNISCQRIPKLCISSTKWQTSNLKNMFFISILNKLRALNVEFYIICGGKAVVTLL